MKFLAFALICFVPLSLFAQADAALHFGATDLKIVERADVILSDPSKWNRHDDRECNDDIANATYSLYCALYKASLDIAGVYIHRRPAMEIVRRIIDKYGQGRVKHHRLMDWNNHPDTTFAEVKKVLKESIAAIQQQLNAK